MADEFGVIDEEFDSSVILPKDEDIVAYEEMDDNYIDDGSVADTDDDDDKVDTSSEAGEFGIIEYKQDLDSSAETEPNDSDDVMDDDVPDFSGTDDDIPEEEMVFDDNIINIPSLVTGIKAGDTLLIQDVGDSPVVIGVLGGSNFADMADNIAAAWQKAQEAYNKSVDSAETLIGAVNKAEQAAQDAATAKEAVAGISQYTWSDAEGTHVSTKEKVTDGAANILVNSAGIDINLDGTAHPTASFTKDGVILREYTKTDIEGEITETNKPIASFTKNGFIVGDSSNAIGALTTDGLLVGSGANKKLAATADGVVMYDSAGSPTATFNTDGIQLAISGQPVANFGNSSIVLGGSNTTSITMAGNACLNVSKLNIGPVYNPITSKDDLKGDKGDKGEPGETPTISTNGNWIINGVETNFSAVGDDGHSPYVSGGIWYEWNASTGKYQSTGIQAQGPQGVQGPSGPSGPKGDKGDDITSQYVYYDASYGLCMTPAPKDLSGYHTRITNEGYSIYNGSTLCLNIKRWDSGNAGRIESKVNSSNYKSATLYYPTSIEHKVYSGTTSVSYANLTKSRLEVNKLYSEDYVTAQGNISAHNAGGANKISLANATGSAHSGWHGLYSDARSGWIIAKGSSGNTLYSSQGSTDYTITKSSTSSRLVKENIEPMPDSIGTDLLNVEMVTFDYKEGYEDGAKGQLGVIAEDTWPIVPEVIVNIQNIDIDKEIAEGGDTSRLGVDYTKFIPRIIKLCQLQQQKIDELEGRIAALENA